MRVTDRWRGTVRAWGDEYLILAQRGVHPVFVASLGPSFPTRSASEVDGCGLHSGVLIVVYLERQPDLVGAERYEAARRPNALRAAPAYLACASGWNLGETKRLPIHRLVSPGQDQIFITPVRAGGMRNRMDNPYRLRTVAPSRTS